MRGGEHTREDLYAEFLRMAGLRGEVWTGVAGYSPTTGEITLGMERPDPPSSNPGGTVEYQARREHETTHYEDHMALRQKHAGGPLPKETYVQGSLEFIAMEKQMRRRSKEYREELGSARWRAETEINASEEEERLLQSFVDACAKIGIDGAGTGANGGGP